MNGADAGKLVDRFWGELEDVSTGMLGLVGAREAHSQPMTAHFEGSSGPLWFYTRSDSDLLQAAAGHDRAVFHYVGKDHELYACIHGRLTVSRDQAVIERFWSAEVERWFPGGKSSGAASLLRFDPDDAQIWLPSSSSESWSVKLLGGEQPPIDVHARTTL